MLTPVIARFLARQGGYEAQLIELDRLVEKIRNGHFELADEVQRDLEYGRLPEGDRKGQGPYGLFTELDDLSLLSGDGLGP